MVESRKVIVELVEEAERRGRVRTGERKKKDLLSKLEGVKRKNENTTKKAGAELCQAQDKLSYIPERYIFD